MPPSTAWRREPFISSSVANADRILDTLYDRVRGSGSSAGEAKRFEDPSVPCISFDASPGSVANRVGGTAGQAALSSEVKLAALSGDGRESSGGVGDIVDPRFLYGRRMGEGERRSCDGGINVAVSYSGICMGSQTRGENVDAGRETRLWRFPKLSSLQVEFVRLDFCLSASLRVDSMASIRPAPSATIHGHELSCGHRG